MNSGAPEEWAVPVPTGCTRIVPLTGHHFNRMIYLSVDPIFQSLWFLSGFDRRLLPTKKLLNQGLRMVKKRTRERTNNDLQNNTQKTEDREIRIPVRSGYELRCSGRVGSSCTGSCQDLTEGCCQQRSY
jgi:hypothetical protein